MSEEGFVIGYAAVDFVSLVVFKEIFKRGGAVMFQDEGYRLMAAAFEVYNQF
jgi:hypothetical protein